MIAACKPVAMDEDSRKSRTIADVSGISRALMVYREEYGAGFAHRLGQLTDAEIYAVLKCDENNPLTRRFNPIGMQLLEIPLRQVSASGQWMDGWGNPYRILISESSDDTVVLGSHKGLSGVSPFH